MCSMLTIAMHVGYCLKEKAEKVKRMFSIVTLINLFLSRL